MSDWLPADAKEPMAWSMAVLSAAQSTVEAMDSGDPRELARASGDLRALINEADGDRVTILAGVALQVITELAETEGATPREWLEVSGLHIAEAL